MRYALVAGFPPGRGNEGGGKPPSARVFFIDIEDLRTRSRIPSPRSAAGRGDALPDGRSTGARRRGQPRASAGASPLFTMPERATRRETEPATLPETPLASMSSDYQTIGFSLASAGLRSCSTGAASPGDARAWRQQARAGFWAAPIRQRPGSASGVLHHHRRRTGSPTSSSGLLYSNVTAGHQ